MTMLILLGANLVMIAALAAALILAVRVRHEAARGKAREALLNAVLGGISNACYRLAAGRLLRVGAAPPDSVWPADFAAVMAGCTAENRAALDAALSDLATAGKGFILKLALDDPTGRVLLLSGRRHGTERPALDLVWASDATDEALGALRQEQMADRLTQLGETLDHLPVAIWQRDAALKIIGGNRRFAEFSDLGVLSESLANLARDRQTAQSRVGAVREGGGDTLPVLITETPFRDGTLGLALDRREIEAARAEITRLVAGHQQVMESVATAIAIYGPDARLIFFNSAFGRLWGLEREFLASEPSLAQVLDTLRTQRALPEYVDYRGFKAAQSALFVELTEAREDLMHLPDGRTVRARVARHPFGGLTFVYDDVTDRLALESSYNTLMEVQRTTLDNLFEGLAVFGGDGRLKLWNPAFAAMWGLQAVDLASRPHIAVLVEKARGLYESGDDWGATKNAMIEQVTAYAAFNGRLERQDGRVLEVNAVPLPDGNMLMSYQDITDGVYVQRALQERNEALEASSRLKSEFIANVSYELRTPLNAVIGFAEILTNQYFGTLSERQLEYSRGILHGSHRLMALIDDILDLATIEAGQMALEPSAVDVHGLLTGILALMRERAARVQLSVAFTCPPDIGTIRVDEKRIRQALFNLVSNAIKFTPVGGSIGLDARRVGDWIALTVQDTGIGIPHGDQVRIFEKFERRGRRAENTGAGLGLPLVKSFIEMHGGRVDLASEPGQGTRITCWLPALATESGPEADSVTPPERPASSNARNAELLQDAPADAPHAPHAPPRQSLSGSV